jgi:hypothetical protein
VRFQVVAAVTVAEADTFSLVQINDELAFAS